MDHSFYAVKGIEYLISSFSLLFLCVCVKATWPGCTYLQLEPWESVRRQWGGKLSSATTTPLTKATKTSTWCSSLHSTSKGFAFLRCSSGSWPCWTTSSAGFSAPCTNSRRCWTATPWLWPVLPSPSAQTKPCVTFSTVLCMTGINVKHAHRNGWKNSLWLIPKTPNISSIIHALEAAPWTQICVCVKE